MDSNSRLSYYDYSLIFFLGLLLLTFGYLGYGLYSVGLSVLSISLAFAFSLLGAILYLSLLIILDFFDYNSPKDMLFAFVGGASFAALIPVFMNPIVGMFLSSLLRIEEEFVTSVFAAPFVEEVSKVLFLLIFFFLTQKRINNFIDAVIYGSMVGLGFAMTENVFYYARASILGEIFSTFIVRSVYFPFLHPIYTSIPVIVYYFVGKIKKNYIFLFLGLLISIPAHSMWNYYVSYNRSWTIFFVVICPILLACLIYIIYTTKEIQKKVKKSLELFFNDDIINLATRFRTRLNKYFSLIIKFKFVELYCIMTYIDELVELGIEIEDCKLDLETILKRVSVLKAKGERYGYQMD